MALDGIVIAQLASELNKGITGARINKISQPEKDELLLTIKCSDGLKRLLISANASVPLLYFTEKTKLNPITAPNFCMLLRKHITNARILSIEQPDMERILVFHLEHLDELGDLCQKKLIIELMGKHSNIILCNDNDMILDSIKHISSQISSVREVLPGRPYFIPRQEGKRNPILCSRTEFRQIVPEKPTSAAKAIYTSLTGLSPLIANEICYRSGIDADAPCASLSPEEKDHLSDTFIQFIEQIKSCDFSPNIVRENGIPIEFSSVILHMYRDLDTVPYESISKVLEDYYEQKSQHTRIRQKSSDLRHVVNLLLERNRKKFELQSKQIRDTEKRDRYKVYGELIHTYGYQLPPASKNLETIDFYTGEPVSIPLDPDLSPPENAKKYFEKYNKLKRTFEALSDLIEDTRSEIIHLESISTALDISEDEADLQQIKEELAECGYIRQHFSKKKQRTVSRPHHYISSDGYDIYVGKNNLQNEEITFKLGEGNDWWFHAKGIPGSHVIIKTKDGKIPDRTFEEGARLAAYYSKGRDSEKVEIDYLQKKNVKKPNKGKPGFVVYYSNFSMAIPPDISMLKELNE